MALINRLDAQSVAAKLADWLPEKLPGAEGLVVEDVEVPQASGMSMCTVLFKACWRNGHGARQLELVARIEPPTPGLFNDSNVGREFRLLTTLGERTDVPVPHVRWVEHDPAVLGSAFIVMDRVAGRVPSDDPPYVLEGWTLKIEPGKRRLLLENALQELVRIGSVDWRALGLDFLDRPALGPPGVDQQLAYLRRYYSWAHGGKPSPTVDAAFQWAEVNKPPDGEIVLNWGDPRIGNVVFDDDLSVAATLDWELATLASPEMDLGWFIFFVRYYSEGLGIPIPDGFQNREELISRYEELSGRRAQHIDYYEVFAALRVAAMMTRAGRLMIESGAVPPDDPMPFSNPASLLLARMLDLPAPKAPPAYFVGRRSPGG
jgi:aminoglycoside phosphotransferase (APT) family kinase protein